MESLFDENLRGKSVYCRSRTRNQANLWCVAEV